MQQAFEYTYMDGVHGRVVVMAPDFVRWELTTKQKMSDLSPERNGVGIGDTARLIWCALTRTGLVTSGFEDWLNTVADVEWADDEPSPTPTKSAP